LGVVSGAADRALDVTDEAHRWLPGTAAVSYTASSVADPAWRGLTVQSMRPGLRWRSSGESPEPARRPGDRSDRLAHRRARGQGHAALLGHACELLRQREPDVLLDHVDLPDRDTLSTQGLHRLGHEHLRRRGAGGDADPRRALQPRRTDVADVVDEVGPGAGHARHLDEPDGVGAVGRADDQQEVDVVGQTLDGCLSILGRVADVVAGGADDLRKLPAQRLDHVARVVDGEGGLGQIGDLVRVRHLERGDLVHGGDDEDAVRRLAERADDLVVVLVTDQDDRVVLTGVADRLEVHLGHQGAGRVDHAKTATDPLLPYLRRDPVRAEDDGRVV